jgi:hypothetical protein
MPDEIHKNWNSDRFEENPPLATFPRGTDLPLLDSLVNNGGGILLRRFSKVESV